MATIRREFVVAAPVAEVWDAVADFGAVHRRLAPGFLTDAALEGDVRTVTFASGQVFREHLVNCDAERRRLVYAIVDDPFSTYQGTVELAPAEDGCRFSWTVDLLPNDLAPRIAAAMDAGAAVMSTELKKLGSA